MKNVGAEQMARLFIAIEKFTGRKNPKKADVARALGVSDQMVNNWEKRGISKEGLISAQEIFGCSLIWLRDGTGPMRYTAQLDAVADDAGNYTANQLKRTKTGSAILAMVFNMPETAKILMLNYAECLHKLMNEKPELFSEAKEVKQWGQWNINRQHVQQKEK